MRPDFDDYLRDLLKQEAQRIPDDATILPSLRNRLATTSPKRSRVTMLSMQRIAIPLGAALVVVAMAITLVAFHSFKASSGGPGNPTPLVGTPTATVAAVASFTPQQVTSSGITIQFDGFAATPIGTIIHYHVVTKTTNPDDEYAALDFQLTDQQHHAIICLRCGEGVLDNTLNAMVITNIYPSSLPTLVPTTLTFTITKFAFVPAPGTPTSQIRDITGVWSITQTLSPQYDRAKTLTGPGVTAGGVTITPQVVDWLGHSAFSYDAGLHIRVALTGLPASSVGKNFLLAMRGMELGGGVAGAPVFPVTLTLPDGQTIAPPEIFAISSSPEGTVAANGTATVEIAFQGVQVKAGDTIVLTIPNLYAQNFANPTRIQTIVGTWVMTINL